MDDQQIIKCHNKIKQKVNVPKYNLCFIKACDVYMCVRVDSNTICTHETTYDYMPRLVCGCAGHESVLATDACLCLLRA